MASSLRSMTGYGRAERKTPKVSAEAEVRTVNGRYLTVRCKLPGRLTRLETRIEAEVKRRMARGSVDVSVRVKTQQAVSPRVDERVLRAYRKAAESLGPVDGAALLALPGVITLEDNTASLATAQRVALASVRGAVAAAAQTRNAEGRRLGVALRRELDTVARALTAIGKRTPAAVKARQRQLRKRLAGLLEGTPLPADDPVLRREVAALADRADITEEADRLAGHVQAFRAALAARGPVGRRLDFLLQEMGREVNTLGAKCNDARIVGHVLRLKAGLEKLREQAANLE